MALKKSVQKLFDDVQDLVVKNARDSLEVHQHLVAAAAAAMIWRRRFESGQKLDASEARQVWLSHLLEAGAIACRDPQIGAVFTARQFATYWLRRMMYGIDPQLAQTIGIGDVPVFVKRLWPDQQGTFVVDAKGFVAASGGPRERRELEDYVDWLEAMLRGEKPPSGAGRPIGSYWTAARTKAVLEKARDDFPRSHRRKADQRWLGGQYMDGADAAAVSKAITGAGLRWNDVRSYIEGTGDRPW